MTLLYWALPSKGIEDLMTNPCTGKELSLTAVSRWKFSSRMRSTGNIELIIISLVNTKLCICINLASMATLELRPSLANEILLRMYCMWAKFSMADVCTWKRPLLSKIWVKLVKFCLYSTKTRCYGGVQQVLPMKSTENFDFNLQKARIFSSKARITREDFKPYWTTDRGKCFNPNCFRLLSRHY